MRASYRLWRPGIARRDGDGLHPSGLPRPGIQPLAPEAAPHRVGARG
ncbi:hypothetical protein [Rubricoccus marinus]|nr:hypothetical protein [Rubricoccus marinus]